MNDSISPKEEDIGTEIEEVEVELPEKYRGKSMDEIVKMHQEAEKKMSSQGQELGNARKLADQLLQAELNRTPPKVEESEDDWEYEPQKATEKLVKTEVGSVKSKVDQIEQKMAIKDFLSIHPEITKDSQSKEYQDWIVNSQYRTKLHNSNVDSFNLEMAEELASAWEEHKTTISTKVEVDQDQRKKDLKAASLETGASTASPSKKIWSRAAIRNMRLYEPEKFLEHRDEITRAYNEKRTKP